MEIQLLVGRIVLRRGYSKSSLPVPHRVIRVSPDRQKVVLEECHNPKNRAVTVKVANIGADAASNTTYYWES